MLRQELWDEIRQLSTEEKLALVEEISRELQQEARLEEVRSLRGVLGMHGDAPTDEEVKAGRLHLNRGREKG